MRPLEVEVALEGEGLLAGRQHVGHHPVGEEAVDDAVSVMDDTCFMMVENQGGGSAFSYVLHCSSTVSAALSAVLKSERKMLTCQHISLRILVRSSRSVPTPGQ